MPISASAGAVEHDDGVGHADGREPVRHQDGDAPAAVSAAVTRACRGGVALEECVLGFGVERGRRLVEYQEQGGVTHETARERQLLPLAERYLDAVRPRRPQLGVEAGHQTRDHVGSARPVDGRRHRGPVIQAW